LVYNVADRFTTTAAFIEGAGIEVEEGTDVAVVMTSVDPPAYAYNLFGMSEPTDEISPEEYEEMWKDSGVLELSAYEVEIAPVGATKNITVINASGLVSASSSDSSIASVAVNGTTIAITLLASEGSATITVTSESTATNRKISKEIAVSEAQSTLVIFKTSYGSPYDIFKLMHNGEEVMWSDASYFETMIQAVKGDTLAIKLLHDVTDTDHDGEVNKWVAYMGSKLGNGNTVSFTIRDSDLDDNGEIKIGINGNESDGYMWIQTTDGANNYSFNFSDT